MKHKSKTIDASTLEEAVSIAYEQLIKEEGFADYRLVLSSILITAKNQYSFKFDCFRE